MLCIPYQRFAQSETKHEEDWAYCLLGIFGIFMQLIYGEGRDLGREKTDLLQKLFKSPYRDRKDRTSERLEGTCEWFT
jgi:hypothetical protein